MHLQTTRLFLRPVRADDADALFRIFGDPETNRFNPAGPYPDIAYAQKVLTKSGLRFLQEIHDVENAAPSLLYGITLAQWRQHSV